MRLVTTILASAAVVLGALSVLALSDRRGIDATPAAAAAAAEKLPHEVTVDGYDPADREVIQHTLDDALRNLRDRRSELEITAAVNAYLHQYFVNRDASGTGAEVLAGKHAACGGTAIAMQEMLYLAGIKSRPAILLGIPYQGNHSLVEVEFENGARGLFDPTFGVFFYDRAHDRPVPMARLLRNPRLAETTLMKSRFEKRRTATGAVRPIASIRSTYRARRDYRELARRPGDSQMDWPLAFRVRRAGGVGGTGEPLTVPVRVRAGKLYGSLAPGTADVPPWNPLALAKDADGVALPWAYTLGRHSSFDVAHRYRIAGVHPGRRYRIAFTYSQAQRVVLRLRRSRSRSLAPVPFADLLYEPGVSRPVTTTVAFTARRRVETLTARASGGSALFQAIRVRPVKNGGGGP